MPKAFLFQRKKYIHAVGVTARVKFVQNENAGNYTGIFQGADAGLIRLSSAAQPSKHQPLAPGMGLKFLRDGVDSANLVSMYSVNGQPGNWNFFANDMVNHIPAPSGFALKILGAKFATATNLI